MVILAIIIWVPIGVFIGLNNSYTEKMMPIICRSQDLILQTL